MILFDNYLELFLRRLPFTTGLPDSSSRRHDGRYMSAVPTSPPGFPHARAPTGISTPSRRMRLSGLSRSSHSSAATTRGSPRYSTVRLAGRCPRKCASCSSRLSRACAVGAYSRLDSLTPPGPAMSTGLSRASPTFASPRCCATARAELTPSSSAAFRRWSSKQSLRATSSSCCARRSSTPLYAVR